MVDEQLVGTQESAEFVIAGYLGDTRLLASIQGVWVGTVNLLISQDGGITWLTQAVITSNFSKSLELKGGVRVKFSAVLASGTAQVQIS